MSERNLSAAISKKSAILLAIVLSLIVFGQFFSKTGTLYLQNSEHYLGFSFVLLGYTALMLRGLLWFYLLKVVDLSLAYPLQSISYVLIIILSAVVFEEEVLYNHIIGCGFILLGSYFIVKK